MTVRDIQRYLASIGISRSKLDDISRTLCHKGRLPLDWHGPNAPHLTVAEVASLLIAVAGTAKSANGNDRLKKVERLKLTTGRSYFGNDIALILDDVSALATVREVRVARNARRALIIRSNGRRDEYLPAGHGGYRGRFLAEGVVTGAVLQELSTLVRQDAAYEDASATN